MSPTRREFVGLLPAGALASFSLDPASQAQRRGVEVLEAAGGVPAHVAGQIRQAHGFQQAPEGHYLVFDRRAHTVWHIAPDRESARAIVTIGQEQGRLYSPSAFAVGPNGFFVVADAPERRERIQLFDDKGIRLAGFTLGGHAVARVTLDTFVLSGVSSLQFTGRSVLLNQPETGALVSEYTVSGSPVRSFGALRQTPHEADRDLHLAFNSGLPLIAPGGGCVFVFVTGEPRFRKYDARGHLLFERLLQGREVDEIVASLPTSWPRRSVAGDELPLVLPTVRAAAVSPDGDLWIVLSTGVIYVYDADGEKIRTVQLRGAGPLVPNSLAFASAARLLVTPGLYEFRVT
jgi:hypothetical protein